MDEQDRKRLADSDVPRDQDPKGDETIAPAGHAYNKYPPFSRERLVLGTVLGVLAVVLYLVVSR